MLPLVVGELDAPLAWRAGRPISRRQYLADVQALAARLPGHGPMLNHTGDRYRFAVGLGAAMLRGQYNLMPQNHQPDTIARLRALYPATYALNDQPGLQLDLPLIAHAPEGRPAEADGITQVPGIDAQALAAQVLTSGSTGAPVPHAKHWGELALAMAVGAERLAEQMGRTDLHGLNLVGTVPAQHSYGFESTVLLALLSGAAFDCDRPFYPADIVQALARMPRPRMLVTTPFHLRMLLEAQLELPTIDLILCATAPLSPQLASRAEAAMGAPLLEIYGCTEAGQVATRRTTGRAEWHTYEGLHLRMDGEQAFAQGAHVLRPTPLADLLELLDSRTFRLLGRSNDLINIAGKRNSIGHLNYHLNMVPGVQDGAFWLPPDDGQGAVVRLVAFVVAPELSATALHQAVTSALRQRVDPAFLPRRIVAVPALPRDSGTGKLPAVPFAAWAEQQLAANRPRSGAGTRGSGGASATDGGDGAGGKGLHGA